MRTRNIIAVLLTATLLGCSGSDAPSSANTDAGAKGSSSTTAKSGLAEGSDGSEPGATAGATTPSSVAGGGSVKADPAAVAALNHYLDALGANDFPGALAVSRDAPQSLAVVRWIVFLGNKDRGGTTASSFKERSLAAVSAGPDEARYTGRVTITSKVSGASGPAVSTTDTFTDLTVRRSNVGWQVVEATYNGAPVLSFPGSAAATAGPLELSLVGAVAFGASLAVVVRLTPNGDHAVDMRDAKLRIRDEQAPATSSLVVGGQPGYVYATYVRRDERPTEWTATLIVDGIPHQVTLAF